MFLLLMLKKYVKNIHTLTINHNLRVSSKLECIILNKYLINKIITHHIITWKHEVLYKSIQEYARIARYKLLIQYCNLEKIKYIFIAHHKNDIIETLLINIIRICGISGLSSINEQCSINYKNIIRPLLLFHKKEIFNIIKKKIFFQEDPSNKNIIFTRIKARIILNNITINTLITNKLFTIDVNAKKTNIMLNNYYNNIFSSFFYRGYFGEIIINASEYLNFDFDIFIKLTNKIIKKLLNDTFDFIKIKKLNFFFNRLHRHIDSIITLKRCLFKKKFIFLRKLALFQIKEFLQ